jgi:hypothetical protein
MDYMLYVFVQTASFVNCCLLLAEYPFHYYFLKSISFPFTRVLQYFQLVFWIFLIHFLWQTCYREVLKVWQT